MERDAALGDVLDRLYAGAGHPSEWVATLEATCRFVGGDVGQLVVGNHDRSVWNDDWFYALTPNLPAKSVAAFLEVYGKSDPRRRIYLASEGRVWLDHQMEPRDFDKSPMVSEFLDPLGVRRQICGVFVRTDTTIGTLNVMRRRADGPFEESNLRAFQRIVPHYSRAFRLHDSVGRRLLASDSLPRVLDLFEAPIIVCSAQGRVIVANQAAIRLHDAGVFRMASGMLAATRADEDASLRTTLAAVLNPGGEATAPGSDGLVVFHDGAKAHPFRVFRLPDAHPLRNLVGQAAMVALIGLVRREGQADKARVFAAVFGLRSAEARLAALLCDGTSLREAAQAMSITVNTARGYLAQLFDRTGTRRQSELVLRLQSAVSVQVTIT